MTSLIYLMKFNRTEALEKIVGVLRKHVAKKDEITIDSFYRLRRDDLERFYNKLFSTSRLIMGGPRPTRPNGNQEVSAYRTLMSKYLGFGELSSSLGVKVYEAIA